METNKKAGRTYVRKGLIDLWQTNVKQILEMVCVKQAELASELGVAGTSVTTMLNRKDHRLTRIQYLATMYVLKRILSEMVNAMDSDIYTEEFERRIFLATGYYSQIIRDEKEKGL